jgi:ketosteroid isomerase-like protein
MLGTAELDGIETVFKGFVAAINDHDVVSMIAVMTEDHLFVDSLGNAVRGAASMQTGWRGYFAMCPDYCISVETILSGPFIVVATGSANGTIDGVAWQTPAAWQAIIRDRKVAEWRVFADNKPVYEILSHRSA